MKRKEWEELFFYTTVMNYITYGYKKFNIYYPDGSTLEDKLQQLEEQKPSDENTILLSTGESLLTNTGEEILFS